jgi:hypothetical protein
MNAISSTALGLALVGSVFARPSLAAPLARNSDHENVLPLMKPGKLFTTRAKVAYY